MIVDVPTRPQIERMIQEYCAKRFEHVYHTMNDFKKEIDQIKEEIKVLKIMIERRAI